jgi:hypothetical protein
MIGVYGAIGRMRLKEKENLSFSGFSSEANRARRSEMGENCSSKERI